MTIRAQAERIGFRIVGKLTRCVGMEPTHLYQYYLDEAENQYIVRRGILTIIAADGRVFENGTEGFELCADIIRLRDTTAW